MTVDVIIPVYNGQSFLAEAIDSVLLQTCLPNKVIVVNDGSTDNSGAIIDSYRDSFVPVIHVQQPNSGLSSARNRGINESDANLIAFLDSDDVWLPTKLERQLEVFHTSPFDNLGFVYCNYEPISATGKNIIKSRRFFQLDPSIRGQVYEKLWISNFIAGSASAAVVRRECFNKVGLFDELLQAAEDWDMWLRISKFYQCDYVNRYLVKIRYTRHSMQRDKTRLLVADAMVVEKLMSIEELDENVIDRLRDKIVGQILYGNNSLESLRYCLRRNISTDLYSSIFDSSKLLKSLFWHSYGGLKKPFRRISPL